MPNYIKLSLAMLIAVVAGALNWMYLAYHTSPNYYLALNDGVSVKAGSRFPSDLDKYKRIGILGDPKRLGTTLIPFDEKNGGALVFDAKASRDLGSGEPIFFSDIAADVPRYETLGPFKLLSVGEHFTGAVETEQHSESGTTITVEPGWEQSSGTTASGEQEYDESTRRLLQIIDAERNRSDSASSHLRIVAIEARPSSSSATSELITSTARAIIVPIDDLANIPKVLQIGTQIAFVVPAYP